MRSSHTIVKPTLSNKINNKYWKLFFKKNKFQQWEINWRSDMPVSLWLGDNENMKIMRMQ